MCMWGRQITPEDEDCNCGHYVEERVAGNTEQGGRGGETEDRVATSAILLFDLEIFDVFNVRFRQLTTVK